MFVITDLGAYWVALDRDDKTQNTVLIRARQRKHLEAIYDIATGVHGQRPFPVLHTPDCDFPYRMKLTKESWGLVMKDLGERIDYGHCKETILQRCGAQYHAFVVDAWRASLNIEDKGARL